MTQWRIYYSDSSVFSSNEGEPGDAPGFGVVCIVQTDAITNRNILSGWDFYYWNKTANQWWGCDIFGLLDRLTNRLPVEAVCQGRTVSSRQYSRIMDLADRDADFPPRGGKQKIERPFVSKGKVA